MSVNRLGKGLGALIGPDSKKKLDTKSKIDRSSDIISKIRVNDIKANPNQPRRYFDSSKLSDLINSIKQKGVITPITVRKIRSGYELVAGERRWRASKKANLKLIPAYVIDVKNQSDIMELALTENIQREDLNPIEESEAYELLHQKYDMSHEMIGKSVGKSRVAISNSIRLLQLPPSIRKSIRLGEISSGHGRAILQAKTIKQMELIWSKIKKDKISVRDAELMVKNKKSSKNKQKKYNARNKEIVNLENRLIETFKTKVRIKSRKNGGCIEVFYFSNKELDRILNILNGED